MENNVFTPVLNHTRRRLATLFWALIAVSLLLVAVFENGLITEGAWAGREQLKFVLLSLTELLTLFNIPVALWMFHWKPLHARLTGPDGPHALAVWGAVRILMLGGLMLLNTLLYYLFGAVAAFGYLAIILLLCMFFVTPSRKRCLEETEAEKVSAGKSPEK